MGYDAHITRKEYWYDDDKSKDISAQEWIAYIDSDSEFRRHDFAEVKTTNDQTVRVDDLCLSVWTKYSGNGVNGNYAWFIHSNGNIVVKNPDVEIRNKMIEVAAILKGKVQGDDGEIYSKEELRLTRKAWWKLW